MAIGGFKDVARRTASDKVLRDKAINISKNPKCDGYQRGLASMVYKFSESAKSSGATPANEFAFKSAITNEVKGNQQQLAEELHKPIIKKFIQIKVYYHLKAIFGVLMLILQIFN